jgi:hypothetical protein
MPDKEGEPAGRLIIFQVLLRIVDYLATQLLALTFRSVEA